MARVTPLTVLSSTVTTNVPPVLYVGEFAWNSPDQKLWIGGPSSTSYQIHLMPTPATTGYTTAWDDTTKKWVSTSAFQVSVANGTVALGTGSVPHASVKASTNALWIGNSAGTFGLNMAVYDTGFGNVNLLTAGTIGTYNTTTLPLLIIGSGLALGTKSGSGMKAVISITETGGVNISDLLVMMPNLPSSPTLLPSGALYRSSASANATLMIV